MLLLSHLIDCLTQWELNYLYYICILNISMTDLIGSLICYAHLQISIPVTQTPQSFKSNGTTPLDDFGTSPSTHYILLCVDTAQALSNGHAPTGVNGILWIYHLYCWLCGVFETYKTVNLGSNKRQEGEILRVVNPPPDLESHAFQN